MLLLPILRTCLVVALLAPAAVAFEQALPASAAPAKTAAVSGTAPGSLQATRRLIENGHAEEALKQLDVLSAQTPALAGVETLRGLAFYNQDHLAQANTAFASALLVDPRDEEARQMRGLTLFRMGKPADAIPMLESNEAARPTNGAGRKDQVDPASVSASVSTRGSENQPGNAQSKADPHYVLALCYIDTRRYDDARHAFAAMYSFPPNSAPAYLLAARMLLRREYLPVAQGFAEKALALDPQLPLAHALLGEIALGGNHLEEAIKQFSNEQAGNPLEPSVYDRLGDAYSRAGQYTEAVSALQRAVLLEPHATGPYILLGKVMLKRQDAVGAATYLERAKSMDPANYMTRSLLGQAYRAMGRHDEATQEIQAAQQLQTASEPKLASPQ